MSDNLSNTAASERAAISWFSSDQFDNVTDCALDEAEYCGADITGVDRDWVWGCGVRVSEWIKANDGDTSGLFDAINSEWPVDSNSHKLAVSVSNWYDNIISTENGGGCAGW